MLFRFIREILINSFTGEGHPLPKKSRPPVYLHQHQRVSLAMLDSLERGDAARTQLNQQSDTKT